jgi:hypothetical protein
MTAAMLPHSLRAGTITVSEGVRGRSSTTGRSTATATNPSQRTNGMAGRRRLMRVPTPRSCQGQYTAGRPRVASKPDNRARLARSVRVMKVTG